MKQRHRCHAMTWDVVQANFNMTWGIPKPKYLPNPSTLCLV